MAKKKRGFSPIPNGKIQKNMDGSPPDVDQVFLDHVIDREFSLAVELLNEVDNVNLRDQMTGATALHFAAAYSARAFLKKLMEREDLEYFIVDVEGHLPSELAWLMGSNEELGKDLMVKEKEAAEKKGLSPWPKPQF